MVDDDILQPDLERLRDELDRLRDELATAQQGRPPEGDSSREYTLARLHRDDPELFRQLVTATSDACR